MLQQTQVSRVIEKYGEFLNRFPTLETIAAARPRQVREAWSGLGYYARAANLHRLARRVVRDDGSAATLPARADELRALPGIGRYTAGAVASFAFEERSALVDTNVARVLRRCSRRRSPGMPVGVSERCGTSRKRFSRAPGVRPTCITRR